MTVELDELLAGAERFAFDATGVGLAGDELLDQQRVLARRRRPSSNGRDQVGILVAESEQGRRLETMSGEPAVITSMSNSTLRMASAWASRTRPFESWARPLST